MPIVNVARVASALNLSEQRVQQLVHEGMPREARGQYDAMKCIRFYIRYLQAVLAKRTVALPDGGYPGVRGEREERVRLLRADADLKEMELAKERARLVALPDVESAMADLVSSTRGRIMALAPRLAPELVGEMSRVMIVAKIEKACKEALSILARSTPRFSERISLKSRNRG